MKRHFDFGALAPVNSKKASIGTRRPKQKDSAEVYIGEEFIGVVFQDEDEDGSFMFEMAILAEDLEG